MAIIAVEVRRFSMELHDAIKAITEHLEKLADLSEDLRQENDFAEKADISDILERSMQTIGSACDKVDAPPIRRSAIRAKRSGCSTRRRAISRIAVR